MRPVRAGANNFGMKLPAWAPKYLAKQRAGKANRRVPCGARRRSDGKPCEALSVPGKRRCKWHGGCSTGPRTAAGKAKVAQNLPGRSPAKRGGNSRRRALEPLTTGNPN